MTLWGHESGDESDYEEEEHIAGQAADRELTLKIACIRSSTPGVTPLKRFRIDARIMDDWEDLEDLYETSFAKQLSSYVQFVEWMDNPAEMGDSDSEI